jgi:hypothetical protein
MKINYFDIKTFLIGALLCGFFSACGSSPATVSAPPDELDAAIRAASDYLNDKVPKGSKAVFLNIKSDYPDLSEHLLSALSENAVNDGVFSVVDRQQLDTIRAEQNFQYSDEVDDETAQSLGRLAGAQIIVSGTVSRVGDLYRLQIRTLSVQTAKITGQFNQDILDGPTVSALSRTTGSGDGATAGRASPAAPSVRPAAPGSAATASAPARPEAPSYKIGDTGPAGGIVFYDKGNNAGGWRYLEAAPASTEWTGVQWAADGGSKVGGTKNGIGDGKKNTQAIVD